jgi:hypothetical protein
MDDQTGSLLDLLDADLRREDDRWRIDRAIERVAMRDHGRVSNNAVRAELTNAHGLTVQPQAIGARVNALVRSGLLEWRGEWEQNTGPNGNAGKPQKVRWYVGRAAA